MNYEFSLTKAAVISLVAGSIVFAVLLFAGGIVVGSEWLGTKAAANSDAVAKNEEADGPKEPVLNDEEPAPKKKAAPKNGGDQKAAPVKEDDAMLPEEAAPPATTQEAAANGGIQIIQEAATDANGAAVASEPDYVTVQVGVFLNQEEANRLLKNIERKGYAPSFFSGRDAEARQWFAVRIGSYSDRQQAANAAANFSKQEKLKAVVRPVGSL
ncbi:MAG TPA: SPOR domain-containing protein [Pyrinomonadaceae bacterium]|nr:SPOR domain-containing protein [Pyrinomonadaceae bacterium]